jgi:hypothetical protein
MDRRRGKQVLSTYDVGHALKRVIDHHRKMIACRQIAAAEDDVAPNLRRRRALRRNGSLAIFGPGETSRSSIDRSQYVEAEHGLVAAGEAVARFCRRKGAAGSGIERRAVRVALSVRGSADLRAAAKTGVDQALPIKSLARRGVIFAVLALPARLRKAKAEPREVVSNGGLELRFAARAV